MDQTADIAARPSDTASRPSWWRRIGRPWRIAIRVVGTIVALLFLAWLILYVTKGRFLKHPFERIASSMTSREVRVGGDFNLYFDPITIHFLAERMTIANPNWASRPNLFQADRIETRIATLPLIVGTRRAHWLDLQGAAVDLEWSADHRTNTWTFSSEPGQPFQMPDIERASVTGTTLRYIDPQMALRIDLAFRAISTSGTQLASAIRFSGDGRARTTPFALTGALLTPNETINGGRNQIEAHLNAARTAIDVTGTLPGATEIEGANLHVTARGANISDLFAVGGLAVPETRAYRLSATLTKAGNEYRFTGLTGRFGDSDVAGRLTVTNRQPRIKLDAVLATRRLDIVDVAPFIGYNPDAIAHGGVTAAVSQSGGIPRLLPDAPLRVDALRNFDANVHYTVRAIRSRNVPVSDIDLTLALDNSLLTLRPLTFTMARGHLTADIAINARRPVVHTDYDVRLSATPMALLLAGYGVDQSGTSGTLTARVRMSGDGNSVRDSLGSANGRIAIIMPRGTFWTRNIQLAELDIGTFAEKMFEHRLREPVRINCGLIGFTVRGGVAAADPILIDTEKNVILGRGGFSFRTEAMDLAFRADAKRVSLFSGQAPVGLNGYFARPGINAISPQLLARAGVGLGLALVATPVAGLLAFVDPGDAQAAQCGPILSGATAGAQRTTSGERRDDVGHGTTATGEDGRQSPEQRRRQRHRFLGLF